MREKQKLKTLYMKVEQREVGAPRAKRLVSIPTSEQVEWIKSGSKNMSVFPRCKLYTNGENNTGPKECKKANDEGDFTIITTVGIANVEFKLFVIVVGGMDFRAMLLKTKVKQKILVLTRIGWILVIITTAKKENHRKV